MVGSKTGLGCPGTSTPSLSQGLLPVGLELKGRPLWSSCQEFQAIFNIFIVFLVQIKNGD